MSQKSYDNKPTLYLIATPIGNMEDITYRAINVLKSVSVIFSEDTRVTNQLLSYYNIKNKLISSHQYNEKDNIDKLLKYLNDGQDVGLVTDRGTPIISDPGYYLAKAAINNNYNVVSIPGATAFVSALITSNIDAQPFTFFGFLNSKSSKRRKELEELKNNKYTLIFYESPHRLIDTLNDMLKILGNRNISISREITKKFEEIYRGTISDVINELDVLKGEFVIVVEGNKDVNDFSNLSILDHVNLYIENGLDSKEAIKKVAHERKLNKNEVYSEYHK
ncbi:MAG TPA: 16S rRNA (cytidine(1402)-2'-O)-methyltransferase [Candidatus Faecisoma merdavium]|nr:16S rRNA (cytidine(1402)-2'-O)-methyltransferase [Candidatus Faecisoma merdavium]